MTGTATLVQHKASGLIQQVSSSTLSFDASTTPGNFLVAALFADTASGTTPSSPPTAPSIGGNSFTSAKWANNNNPSVDKVCCGIWYLANCAGGNTAVSFTIPNTGSFNLAALHIFEFTGAAYTSLVAASNSSNSSSGTTAWTTGSVNSANLLLGILGGPSGGSGNNIASGPGGSWTGNYQAFGANSGSSGTNMSTICSYELLGSGSTALSVTASGAQHYSGCIVAFTLVADVTSTVSAAIPRTSTALTAQEGTPFPGLILDIAVELLVNGVWTDITDYVYGRNDIIIERGRPDEGSTGTSNPQKMTLTLNNRDGRFSPKNSSGPYYGFIGRNTQIRVSVQDSAIDTTARSYRFWGEISAWPPSWDETGTDVYVSVVASGVLRRLSVGATVGSALYRYYTQLTGADAPVVYWPCEDGTDSTTIASGLSDNNIMGFNTASMPSFAQDSSFAGSDPILQIQSSEPEGVTTSFSTSGDDFYNFSAGNVNSDGTFTWTCPVGVTTVDAIGIGGGGGGGGGFSAGGGGGGGEYAEEASLAVTPGTIYSGQIGLGGTGGSASVSSTPGSNSTFTGDSVTLTAHGGSRGTATPSAGAGGTGSSNTKHHNGGAGGTSASNSTGGGGSGGDAAAGNTADSSGTGAAAVSYSGAGQIVPGPGGDGAGASAKNYTSFYTATHTYCYQGTNGTQPSQRINVDGSCLQGDDLLGDNGNTCSFLLFNYSQIQSDLSGATINSISIRLDNKHSWYNSGMTVAVGYGNQTSFGTSRPSLGAHTDLKEKAISENDFFWWDITSTGAGAAFKSGSATCLILYHSTSSRTFYGYFTGAGQSNPPQLSISYSK